MYFVPIKYRFQWRKFLINGNLPAAKFKITLEETNYNHLIIIAFLFIVSLYINIAIQCESYFLVIDNMNYWRENTDKIYATFILYFHNEKARDEYWNELQKQGLTQ